MLRLRRAEASDAPALARVHVDSWQAAYRGLVADSVLKRFTYEWREERFRQSLAAHAEPTYIAYLGDNMVGILTLGIARDADLDLARTGEIWGIYLAPSYWRQGIGRRLFAMAEAMLLSRGYDSAVLWVLEGNDHARRFYEAMGFALDGGRKEVDFDGILPVVRYRKQIKASGG